MKSEAIQQLQTIIEFRKTHLAPVDSMGCHTLAESLDPKAYRFQSLIGLMLSSRTKDQMTAKAMENLKTLAGGLSAKTLVATNPATILSMIKCVGFAPTKCNNIIKAAQVCLSKYGGDIPPTFDALTELDGVGVKMATLAMKIAWGNVEGIGVDTHVHRISNLLGWVSTDTPDQTEVELQKVVPKQYWKSMNQALVGFGQTICPARSPKCGECPINQSCPCSQI